MKRPIYVMLLQKRNDEKVDTKRMAIGVKNLRERKQGALKVN